MAKIIVVTSGKGGVGKTTTSAAISSGLALAGHKTVVIDFDIGLRNLDIVMNCERRVVYDFVNVINGEANLRQALIKDKRVILVDDSVVRGTTSRKIKEMILDAGAAEVHFRIASPPTAWPCFYGVDTPQREKLLAATMSEEEMRDHLGVDSLKFISLDGLYRAVGAANGRDPNAPAYCDACFSGEYPVAPSDMMEKGFQPKAAAKWIGRQ